MIMPFKEILAAAGHNQFLVGAGGAGAIGYVLMQIRALPGKVASVIGDQFTVHLVIRGEDFSSEMINDWLAAHPWIKKSRRLATTTKRASGKEMEVLDWLDSGHNLRAKSVQVPVIIPGPGTNWIRYNGHFIRVSVQDSSGGGGEEGANGHAARVTTTTLMMFGRSRKVFDQIMKDVAQSQKQKPSLDVFIWSSGRFRMSQKTLRPFSTVFIDPAVKDAILSDAKKFFSSNKWYEDRALAHRRGYLLDGPPGSGKTSTIMALASELGLPLFVVNPNAVGDDALGEVLQSTSNGIVVLEDIDSLSSAHSREDADKPSDKPLLSLSGLLNAIDGLAASENRILILTTNKPEILDSALVRPGRIDRKFHIGYLAHDLAQEMTERFLGDDYMKFFIEIVVPRLGSGPLSPAELQNILLEEIHKRDIDEDNKQIQPPGAPIPDSCEG